MNSKQRYLSLLMLFLLGIFPIRLQAQVQDSLVEMSLQQFFARIVAYHPVMKQAQLLSNRAQEELRLARGVLDPKLNAELYHKEFKGIDYFTIWDNYVKVPLWYGVDIKTGYERNTGVNVNGESFTPTEGLSYIGLSVPLGRDLVIDARRNTIKQARLLRGLAEAEQVSRMNKLLLQAAKDYWDWMFAYRQWNFRQQGFDLASFRLGAVKERVEQGDMSAIDSVEALIQVQRTQVLLQESKVFYDNAMLNISNYLWSPDSLPIQITERVIPVLSGAERDGLSPDSLASLASLAQQQHPDLRKMRVKMDQLNIEQKFLKDRFKPGIYAQYSLLQQDFPLGEAAVTNRNGANNYKFGVNFTYPLYLRKERGKLELNKIKLMENNLSQRQMSREISNSIQAAYNNWINFEEQLDVLENMVAQSRILRDGEQVRFDNGESSLFLINQRENNLIKNEIKLYELWAKYAKNKSVMQWASGNPLATFE